MKLEEAHALMIDDLPAYYVEAESKIEEMLEEGRTLSEKTKLYNWRAFIKNYTRLSCYGFNSARFDLPCIASTLFTVGEEHFGEISALKRGSAYISVGFSEVQFKDILNLSSPCNLGKYLKTWGAKENKSIFPHGYYANVEEMKLDVDFPPKEKFNSTLNGSFLSDEEYFTAKNEFERRKKLPEGNKLKMNNMLDWLVYYNLIDVQPFADAIENQFRSFWDEFKEDLNLFVSIPKVAEQISYKAFNPESALFVSFNQSANHLREDFRMNLLGGLTSCFHRFVNLRDDTGPAAARFAPNGNKYSHLTFLDFNSLYLMVRKNLSYSV